MKRRFKRGSYSVRCLTGASLVAAIYTVMTFISAALGMSSGAIQFRLSESLIILPLIMPEAVPGLFIGCLISNIISGCALWDIIFGSLATLLGAYCVYLLRNLPLKLRWLSVIPNFLINSLVIPLVLMYAYGINKGYLLLVLSVGLGELVCGVILASIFYYAIREIDFIHRKQI